MYVNAKHLPVTVVQDGRWFRLIRGRPLVAAEPGGRPAQDSLPRGLRRQVGACFPGRGPASRVVGE